VRFIALLAASTGMNPGYVKQFMQRSEHARSLMR
jgi:hypothetical protein